MEANKNIIETFYTAFKEGNVNEMISCYHDEVLFEDPAFGKLKGEDAKSMWRMLVERSKGEIQITFKDIEADVVKGKAYWEAKYFFSKTGRPVYNKIHADFLFKDGKIIKHTDQFNLWKWSSMALGFVGLLLGFTPLIKNKIRANALEQLKKYKEKRADRI